MAHAHFPRSQHHSCRCFPGSRCCWQVMWSWEENPKPKLWKVKCSLFPPLALGNPPRDHIRNARRCPSNSPGFPAFKARCRSKPPPKGVSNLSWSQHFLLLRNAEHLFTTSGIPLTQSHTEQFESDISGTVESPFGICFSSVRQSHQVLSRLKIRIMSLAISSPPTAPRATNTVLTIGRKVIPLNVSVYR